MSSTPGLVSWLLCVGLVTQGYAHPPSYPRHAPASRERLSLNADWRFRRWEENPDGIVYDYRKDLENLTDVTVLKPWILPSGNDFLVNATERYKRPSNDTGTAVEYAQPAFDDGNWTSVNLPHDWAIAGPFYTQPDDVAIVGGGMGRLPVFGVGWYRRSIDLTSADEHKEIYLDVEGAMSYAMVWLNGHLVGGWPYPYNSWRLDLTPYVNSDSENLLAIRLDNPVESARWYPGGGLYRDIWLTKVEKIHIGQWGTRITTTNVTDGSAVVALEVVVESSSRAHEVNVLAEVFTQGPASGQTGVKVASFPTMHAKCGSTGKVTVNQSISIHQPMLWGPSPSQVPNLYVAVVRVIDTSGRELDRYQTTFGIRQVDFTPDDGLHVNGERIPVQGVNQHHDLGAIGAAFNIHAAERQLNILREMGVNALRTAHNPPAPELLDLTDRMGFVVFDEVFDCWYRNKTDNDFHLIFGDWHEQDLRAMIRRDRNHPSVILWSFGNEVGEQQHNDEGPIIGAELRAIVHSEDSTRPATSSLNFARPGNAGSLFPTIVDVLSLNYQGEGIRDIPAYSNLNGTATPPAFPLFHEVYPEKMLWSSESASALSSRGIYLFPVTPGISAPINDSSGGSTALAQVSAYELYSADYGMSADRAFEALDWNPYAAGEFVWTGTDYLGEPTPYYTSRSSYSGIVDLAGFPKDRFYLYQARWRPDLPMVHILPHWNWPDRTGEVTPVHVFTSGDEAEVFLNGRSLGRKSLGDLEYRLRWDEALYEPGEVCAVAYKNGEEWARETVRTTGPPASIKLTTDRKSIAADGVDLAYITAEIVDAEGLVAPTADTLIVFEVSQGGIVVATDNGNAADLVAFPSLQRRAFSGKALAILKAGEANATITVTARSGELGMGSVKLVS